VKVDGDPVTGGPKKLLLIIVKKNKINNFYRRSTEEIGLFGVKFMLSL
jgi:hypothetical protein